MSDDFARRFPKPRRWTDVGDASEIVETPELEDEPLPEIDFDHLTFGDDDEQFD